MSSLFRKIGGWVTAGVASTSTPYRHVSEFISKALMKGHPFSSKRWPHDQGDGQFERGNVFCQDGEFWQKERALNTPAGYAALAANDEILMSEWPSFARLRSVRIRRTVAAAADNPGVTTNPQVLKYMDSNANPAAFPTFDIIAKDPSDPSFTPIVIATVGTVTDGFVPINPIALAYGINRRKQPLEISIKVAGAVPANSGCVLFCDFVGQHL